MFLQPNDSPVNLLIHFDFSFLHRFRFACSCNLSVYPFSRMRVCTCDNIVNNLDINICGKRREREESRSTMLRFSMHFPSRVMQIFIRDALLYIYICVCVFRVIRNKLWIKFISMEIWKIQFETRLFKNS